MTLDFSTPELSFALEIARQGALLARTIRAEMEVLNLVKSDCSPVTVADFAIQALAARALEQKFPDDALVAEESADMLRQSPPVLDAVCRFLGGHIPEVNAENVCAWIDRGASRPGKRFWVLDPIDGTKGYLRGGQYAVALAVVAEGTVELGVLGCPGLDGGALAVAARGQGAWKTALEGPREFRPLRASQQRDIAQVRLLRSFESGHTNVQAIEELVRLLGINAEPVLMDSQAKYAVLAAGNAEILLRLLSAAQPNYREKIWDIAAGAIVIEEAGGRITDLDGGKLDFSAGRRLENNLGICATNGPLHEQVLAGLRIVASD